MKRALSNSLAASAGRGAIAMLLIAAATPALAQADSTPQGVSSGAGEIVVTGTLIRGVAPVGAPVLGVTADEIIKAGAGDSTAALRMIPQVFNLGADQAKTGSTTNLANANNTFGSGINIRGLGTQATLTLVNGFRPAPNGIFGIFFDPAAIPTIALSGIDVVADGSSALYGSDAIAGVANLKLRKDLDGVDLSGRYNFADNYHSYQIAGAAGKRWDHGRVMVAAEYSSQTPLFAADRPLQYEDNQVSVGGADRRSNFGSPSANILVGSTLYGVNNGVVSTTPNRLSTWAGATAIPQQKRFSIVGAGEFEVAPSITVYAQGFYSKRDFSKAYGRAGLAAQTATLTVRSTNPYYVTGVPGLAVGANESATFSFLDALGPEDQSGFEKGYQIVAGLRATLTSDIQLDISYDRGHSQDLRNRLNQVNTCALSGATTSITPVCTVPAGQVAGGAIAQTTAANAFNPFGPNNAAVLNSIRAAIFSNNIYQQDSFQAKLDGTLSRIGGGNVKFALGASTMREFASYLTSQNNDTADNTITRIAVSGSNSRRVNSVFGEVVVPLVGPDNAMAGVESLTLSGAVRYDHYSDQGNTTNPKLGLTWGVGGGLKLRGSYGTSFRSSLIQTDPNANGGVASRLVADYTVTATPATNRAIVLTGGNRSLKPETARTITLGMDYNPDWDRKLRISATYFNINYKDIIDNTGNNIGVTGIPSAQVESDYALFIQRRPTDAAGSAAFTALAQSYLNSPLFLVAGGVPTAASVNLIINGQTLNAGRLETRGVDFSVFHSFDTSAGEFEAGLLGTYFFNFKRTFSPTVAMTERAGLIEFPTKYNLRGTLSWRKDGFRAATFINYLPSYTNTFTTPASTVSSYTTVDLTVGYTFGDNAGVLKGLGISLESSNLFNKAPPLAFVGQQLFDSNNASVLGRQVAVRVRKAF